MMQPLSKTIILRDGAVVPRLAYGMATVNYKKSCADNIFAALKAGFRHIDAAEDYANVSSVGEAIEMWETEGGKRDDVFITTKWGLDEGSSAPRSSLERQLKEMGLEYVDLYLFHKPECEYPMTLSEAWKEMEDLKAEGLCRHIGVSNFQVQHLEELATTWKDIPVVNQVEYHPYCTHTERNKAAAAFGEVHGISTMSFSALTPLTVCPDGPVDQVVRDIIGHKKGMTMAQALLLWALQTTDGPLVTVTKTPERLEEYLAIFEAEPLGPEELQAITKAGQEKSFRKWS